MDFFSFFSNVRRRPFLRVMSWGLALAWSTILPALASHASEKSEENTIFRSRAPAIELGTAPLGDRSMESKTDSQLITLFHNHADQMVKFRAANVLISREPNRKLRTELALFLITFYFDLNKFNAPNFRAVLNERLSRTLLAESIFSRQRQAYARVADPAQADPQVYRKAFGGNFVISILRPVIVDFLQESLRESKNFSEVSYIANCLSKVNFNDFEISELLAKIVVTKWPQIKGTAMERNEIKNNKRTIAIYLASRATLNAATIMTLASHPKKFHEGNFPEMIYSMLIRSQIRSESADLLMAQELDCEKADLVARIILYFRDRELSQPVKKVISSHLGDRHVMNVVMDLYPDLINQLVAADRSTGKIDSARPPMGENLAVNNFMLRRLMEGSQPGMKNFAVLSLLHTIGSLPEDNVRHFTEGDNGQRVAQVLSEEISKIRETSFLQPSEFYYIQNLLAAQLYYGRIEPNLERHLLKLLDFLDRKRNRPPKRIPSADWRNMEYEIIRLLTKMAAQGTTLQQATVHGVANLSFDLSREGADIDVELNFFVLSPQALGSQDKFVAYLLEQAKAQKQGKAVYDSASFNKILKAFTRISNLNPARQEVLRRALENAELRRAVFQENPAILAMAGYELNDAFLDEILFYLQRPLVSLSKLLVLLDSPSNSPTPVAEKNQRSGDAESGSSDNIVHLNVYMKRRQAGGGGNSDVASTDVAPRVESRVLFPRSPAVILGRVREAFGQPFIQLAANEAIPQETRKRAQAILDILEMSSNSTDEESSMCERDLRILEN